MQVSVNIQRGTIPLVVGSQVIFHTEEYLRNKYGSDGTNANIMTNIPINKGMIQYIGQQHTLSFIGEYGVVYVKENPYGFPIEVIKEVLLPSWIEEMDTTDEEKLIAYTMYLKLTI